MSQGYARQRIALLTQHGKERVIAPILEPALGCTVERVIGFDTDRLGTFTRDIPRDGSQLEAARRKARIGMQLSGVSIGLASEGSFGPDPHTGLFPWNVELLVLVDDRLGIEIAGVAQGPGRCGHIQTGDWSALESFARNEGFPEHHLVLRPQDQDDRRIKKGISDWVSLRQGFDICRAEAENSQVVAEIDLRACANPTRMRQIGQAAEDLLKRLQSHCPHCAKPGYWPAERKPGLPCSVCGLPTRMYKTEVWECAACKQRVEQPRTDRLFAEPRHCDSCNP